MPANPTGSLDSSSKTSLRSALESASSQTAGGTWTINLPAGTYNLSLGDLPVGTYPNTTITILGQGAGPANTVIHQTKSHLMVFIVNYNVDANVVFNLQNVTVSGGNEDDNDVDGFGGGGGAILAGGDPSASGNVLTLTNVVFSSNTCVGSGGAVEMTGGGDLTAENCVFSGNQAGLNGPSGAIVSGGAIVFGPDGAEGDLSVYNSTFANNTATGNGNSGAKGPYGGAIYLEGTIGNTYTINQCTFTGNRITGTSTTTDESGGAVHVDSGHLTANFNRITGNVATTGSGLFVAGGAWADARNNWWGGNSGPNATGGDTVATATSTTPPNSTTPLGNGQVAFSPYITLVNTANPGTIAGGGSTTLTASFLQNSSGQTLTAAEVSALVGLPVMWSGMVHGSFGGEQTTIQADGEATATFNNDGTCNNGSGNATVDNATATASVTVQCPDLTVSQANSVSGTVGLGGSWTWTIHIANGGVGAANFASGQTILTDNLPNAGVSYGTPTTANASGLTGSVSLSIDVNGNLSCAANGAVQLAGGGSFDIKITVTPSVVATYTNPRAGGLCRVDPNNVVVETNEGNNDATANSVAVTKATVTITSGVTANNKVFDGTTTATLSFNNAQLGGVLPGDLGNVSLSTGSYTATFANAGPGNGITVTVIGLTLSGSAAGNYSLAQPSLSANITQPVIGVTILSGLTANNKIYDGTTTASLSSNNVVLNGVLAADAANVALLTNGYTANFGSANAGNGQSVTVGGLSLTGSAANKYVLSQPPTSTPLTANITGAPVTIKSGLTPNNKPYDGTTTATLSSNNVVLLGVLPADASNVALSTNGYTANFASAAVGNGIQISVSGLTLTGSAEGNYSLTQPSLFADITCPVISASPSGSTAVCPGNPAVIMVVVVGGTGPYSVTLDNGGGTQVGASPLQFVVSPATTTTYSISSGTDSAGCPVSGNGAATITVSTPPTAGPTPSGRSRTRR